MSYKAMIVEDNAIYRYAIKTIIDWSAYGFDLAAEAINGKQALQILEHQRFDLILTDVSMPEMNGIDLIQAIKRRTPDTVVVMLSSYDDFRFVKDSLKLGARDYLLKHDLEPESLLQMLGQVKEWLEQQRSELEQQTASQLEAESQFMKRIMLGEGEWEDSDGMLRLAEERKFTLCQSPYMLLSVQITEPSCAEKGIVGSLAAVVENGVNGVEGTGERVVPISISSSKFVVAIGFHRCRSEADMRIAAYDLASRLITVARSANRNASAGMSGIGAGLSELKGSFEQAEAALFQTAYERWNRVYAAESYSTDVNNLDSEYAHRWMTALKHGDSTSMEAALEELFLHVRKVKPGKPKLRKLLFDVFAAIGVQAGELRLGEAMTKDWDAAVQEALERMDSPELLFEWVMSSCSKLLGMKSPNRLYRKEIQLAIDYIHAHYMEQLTVAALSKELNFSANYLSNLFRSETGMRFIEYVNRVRMDTAKRLLRDSRLKVYEVAEKVGYQDTSYFCKVFKEVTGLTVSMFRGSGQGSYRL
ncbi:response regulator transcription factor [Cohnella silvisoli]|uniref:Response regulator n=1 Tax=Cohnella silvisoli TaxID=2873699 RepID=A0ABV1KLB6_9BACL|nr:response regulator [Cohnella silvisoli]MCD9020746.1 response regulator [Cohnella silvisoli]